MKRLGLILLVLVLLCTGCRAETGASAPVSSGAASQPVFSLPEGTVENPVTYFSMSISHGDGTYEALTAYGDDKGGAYVEYVGKDTKKVGTLPGTALHTLALVVEDTQLPAMHEENVNGEGSEYASAYIAYEDEAYIGASYSGTVPEEFLRCYETMEKCFLALTADLPVYVPQPLVMDGVEEGALNAILEILTLGGVEPLDALSISDVPKDDFFPMAMGLSTGEGIAGGTLCAPLMMPNAYSLVVARVEDKGSVDAVRQDFEDNLNWAKWVCVSASDALIAEKDDLVLCLMGGGDWFEKTAAGIEAAGWTNLRTLENK